MALKRNIALFFIILFISGISACGKTGSLYLPDESAGATFTVVANAFAATNEN